MASARRALDFVLRSPRGLKWCWAGDALLGSWPVVGVALVHHSVRNGPEAPRLLCKGVELELAVWVENLMVERLWAEVLHQADVVLVVVARDLQAPPDQTLITTQALTRQGLESLPAASSRGRGGLGVARCRELPHEDVVVDPLYGVAVLVLLPEDDTLWTLNRLLGHL